MFDASRYLSWLQSAAAKHYADHPNGEPFSVIAPNCTVRSGYLSGKRVAVPRCCRDMEQVAFLAREQLAATLNDGCGTLEFDPPTIDSLWDDGEREPDTGEVIGHAFDIMNDARVWEAIAKAALTFRSAAEHVVAQDTINKYATKEPQTVEEARRLRNARETVAA